MANIPCLDGSPKWVGSPFPFDQVEPEISLEGASSLESGLTASTSPDTDHDKPAA
jgi:hypothetical protein